MPEEQIEKSAEPIFLSYTSLKLFTNCRRANYWKYYKRVYPLGSKPAALEFGTDIHKLLELWHVSRDRDLVLKTLSDEYDGWQFSDSLANTYLNAKAMFAGYMQRYATEDFEIVYLEKPFKEPILDTDTHEPLPGVLLTGKIDGIARRGERYYILEHKTAKSITQSYLDRLWMDFQIFLYTLYAERIFNIRIDGIIYNVLSKANIQKILPETSEAFDKRRQAASSKNKSGVTKIQPKAGESDEAYYEKLQAYYETPAAFHREEIPVSPTALQRVAEELSELTKAYLSAHKRGRFYMNTDYCFNYGRPCDYYKLCANGDSSEILNKFYNVKSRPQGEILYDEEVL